MECFAVIATYNGKAWIEKCINSIKSDLGEDHIIVVDNHSTDETVHIVQALFPKVVLICNDENAGFGGANNQGIVKAVTLGAAYVLLLNQDARIRSGTISDLSNILHENPDYGILSPVHFNGDGTLLDHGFKTYVTNVYPTELADKIEKNKSGLLKIYSVPFINAAAWMISRECIKRVGLFNSAFFHYGEDVNYCNRVLFHGLKIGFTPYAEIYHDRNDPGKFSKKEALGALGIVPLNAVLDPRTPTIFDGYLKATRKITELGFEGVKLLSAKICWQAIRRWIDLILDFRKIRKIRKQTKKAYPALT